MDAETYSHRDVIEFAATRYVAADVNIFMEDAFARRHDVSASPAQAILTPEGELMGRRTGYISATQLMALARPLAKSGYGEYLLRCLAEKSFP